MWDVIFPISNGSHALRLSRLDQSAALEQPEKPWPQHRHGPRSCLRGWPVRGSFTGSPSGGAYGVRGGRGGAFGRGGEQFRVPNAGNVL